MSIVNKGLHTHRLKNNPAEKRLHKAWKEMNKDGSITGYLTSEDPSRQSPSSPEEELVVATTIQWLGSPVGQAFLRRAGFYSEEERQRAFDAGLSIGSRNPGIHRGDNGKAYRLWRGGNR